MHVVAPLEEMNPLAQRRHLKGPAAYCPFEHTLHCEDAFFRATLPDRQGEQAEAPFKENVPRGQGEHTEDPGDAKVPARQLEHLAVRGSGN